MVKATIKIDMYDAKEVHPSKNCDVIVITSLDNGKMNTIMGIRYEDGHFNGKEYSMNDRVILWAYMSELESVVNKEEDDF